MKVRAGCFVVLVMLGGAFAGCRGGSNVAPSAVTSAKAAEGKRAEPPIVKGRPVVHVLYDDPRLAPARELERAKDFAGAAKVVHDARPADLPTSDACAWDHLEGRLLAAANAPEAVAAFDRASAPTCPIAAWSMLRAAQAVGRGGNADDALRRARAVPEDVGAAKEEVQLLVAEALGAKNERAAALPMWRAWLAANPHGSRWVDTSIRIATAWLDAVDGPPEAHAREAYDLATRVVVEAPKVESAVGASAVRARAVALLRGKDPGVGDALSDLERARQAQGWLDANEPVRAWDLATQVLAAAGGKPGPAACKAAMVRANAASKAKKNGGEPWGDAVAACEKDEQLAQALYSGAKARAGKDARQAIAWFSRLEQAFPKHRLADDARLRGAMLVLGSSEEGASARAEEMLRTLPDAYPAGDMRTEALFRAALERMKRGDWEGARPHLERILALAPDDRHWATAGRAAYFLARADAKAGKAAEARARYVEIVQKYPLAFYMLLSHARLAEGDAALAKKTLADAVARDSDDGAAAKAPPAVLTSAPVLRAARLLEVGEIDAAKKEIAASGALAEGADADVAWEIGAIYNQAGMFDLGHAFSRRPHELFTHYPEGRWRQAWEVAYPRAFQPLVTKACGDRGLPTTVAWAIMREESSFFPEAKSPSNAYGLMQLILPTAQWVAKGTPYAVDETQLKRPEVSIELGVKLLASLRTKHGHPALAIGAYNGGSGAIDRWMSSRASDELDLFVELVPWEETRNYVKRVLSTQAAYAYLYDPGALAEPLGLPLGFAR